MVENDEEMEFINKLLEENSEVRKILISSGICGDGDCTTEKLIVKLKEYKNTGDLWKNIAQNFGAVRDRGTSGSNAFLEDLKKRHDNAISQLGDVSSVDDVLENNYDEKKSQNILAKEMRSERTRINNSEKIKLAVWGIVTFTILGITFYKLKN